MWQRLFELGAVSVGCADGEHPLSATKPRDVLDITAIIAAAGMAQAAGMRVNLTANRAAAGGEVEPEFPDPRWVDVVVSGRSLVTRTSIFLA